MVEEDAPPHEVTLAPEAVARIGLETSPAIETSLRARALVPAEIQTRPEAIAHVASHVGGHIERVQGVLGARVQEGDVLAELHSPAIGDTRSERAAAKAALKLAKTTLERQRRLNAEGITPGRRVQEAEEAVARAKAQLAAAEQRYRIFRVSGRAGGIATVNSPIAGEIILRHAVRGEVVEAHDTLFEVADLSKVLAVGHARGAALASLRPGVEVAVRFSEGQDPARTWRGAIRYVANTLDEGSRAAEVHVVLDNADGSLRPGLFGTMLLPVAPAAPDGLAVPEDAVQRVGDGHAVFVQRAPTRFEAIAVRPGARSDGLVEVRPAAAGALVAGDLVVTRGAFALKSELLGERIGGEH